MCFQTMQITTAWLCPCSLQGSWTRLHLRDPSNWILWFACMCSGKVRAALLDPALAGCLAECHCLLLHQELFSSVMLVKGIAAVLWPARSLSCTALIPKWYKIIVRLRAKCCTEHPSCSRRGTLILSMAVSEDSGQALQLFKKKKKKSPYEIQLGISV